MTVLDALHEDTLQQVQLEARSMDTERLLVYEAPCTNGIRPQLEIEYADADYETRRVLGRVPRSAVMPHGSCEVLKILCSHSCKDFTHFCVEILSMLRRDVSSSEASTDGCADYPILGNLYSHTSNCPNQRNQAALFSPLGRGGQVGSDSTGWSRFSRHEKIARNRWYDASELTITLIFPVTR